MSKKGKSDNLPIIVALAVIGYLVLRDTVQASIMQAGTNAGAAAGASAVNTAVGDIQQIAAALGNL